MEITKRNDFKPLLKWLRDLQRMRAEDLENGIKKCDPILNYGII